MAVSHAERTRCPGCGVFVRGRAELDDWDAEERAYRAEGDLLDDHECPALDQYGPRRETVTRAPRRERPRSSAVKRKTYLRKHVCACQPPRILRAASTDLTDVTCGRCSTYFVWSPSPAELSDDDLAGRRPA
jgi:hypothetical protein